MSVPDKNSRFISNWLFATAFSVFTMVVIGAITRLTESGLSMVEWKPLIGALPPMNDAEWSRVFELYKQTPEFQKKNFWMGIEEFKSIFFWEWLHRLWGRIIGLIYGLPFLFFLLRGMIPQGYRLKLFGMLVLGGLQGLMGWYMVKSGLIDMPAVSHYRLAAHLFLAFLIFGLLIWLGLSLRRSARTPHKALYRHGWLVLLTIIVTIFWGAFVAGLDAGMIYNEYPLMGGQFIPPEMWNLSPYWLNIFENHSAVQFTHRWLAMFSALMVAGFYLHALHHRHQINSQRFSALHALVLMVFVQMGLGIATLLSQVNLPLAILHQAGALSLVGLSVAVLHRLRPLPDHPAAQKESG